MIPNLFNHTQSYSGSIEINNIECNAVKCVSRFIEILDTNVCRTNVFYLLDDPKNYKYE